MLAVWILGFGAFGFRMSLGEAAEFSMQSGTSTSAAQLTARRCQVSRFPPSQASAKISLIRF